MTKVLLEDPDLIQDKIVYTCEDFLGRGIVTGQREERLSETRVPAIPLVEEDRDVYPERSLDLTFERGNERSNPLVETFVSSHDSEYGAGWEGVVTYLVDN